MSAAVRAAPSVVQEFVRTFRHAVRSRPNVWIGWMEIDPATAQAMLDKYNTHNRLISKNRVQRYAVAMSAKKWVETGEPLVIDSAGVVVIGQHRLKACVESGKPFTTAVVVGVSPDARWIADEVKPKTFSHRLQMLGERDTDSVAGAHRWYARYHSFSPPGSGIVNDNLAGTLSSLDYRRIREEHPRLSQCVREMRGLLSGFGGRALHGWLYYEFTRLDRDIAEQFRACLLECCNGIPRGSGWYALRRYLDNTRTSRHGATMRSDYIAACTIQAWNGERSGRPVKLVRWRQDADFPVIQ